MRAVVSGLANIGAGRELVPCSAWHYHDPGKAGLWSHGELRCCRALDNPRTCRATAHTRRQSMTSAIEASYSGHDEERRDGRHQRHTFSPGGSISRHQVPAVTLARKVTVMGLAEATPALLSPA